VQSASSCRASLHIRELLIFSVLKRLILNFIYYKEHLVPRNAICNCTKKARKFLKEETAVVFPDSALLKSAPAQAAIASTVSAKDKRDAMRDEPDVIKELRDSRRTEFEMLRQVVNSCCAAVTS
jgi:hypothetical protein